MRVHTFCIEYNTINKVLYSFRYIFFEDVYFYTYFDRDTLYTNDRNP